MVPPPNVGGGLRDSVVVLPLSGSDPLVDARRYRFASREEIFHPSRVTRERELGRDEQSHLVQQTTEPHDCRISRARHQCIFHLRRDRSRGSRRQLELDEENDLRCRRDRQV